MAIKTQGTTYTVDGTDDGGLNPLSIGDVVSANWGDGAAAEIDTTTQASSVVQIVAGIPDKGNLTMELLDDEDDTGQIAINAAIDAGSSRTFVIVQSSGTIKTHTFNAIPMSFPLDNPVNGVATRSLTARIVTLITLT